MGNFNYNISEELFIDCIDAIERFNVFQTHLYDLGIDADNIPQLNSIINLFTTLISKCVNDEDATDLSYFMYELRFGDDWTPNSITDSNGNSIDMSCTKSLYKYFVERNNNDNK